jgi:hypothetical protein
MTPAEKTQNPHLLPIIGILCILLFSPLVLMFITGVATSPGLMGMVGTAVHLGIGLAIAGARRRLLYLLAYSVFCALSVALFMGWRALGPDVGQVATGILLCALVPLWPAAALWLACSMRRPALA